MNTVIRSERIARQRVPLTGFIPSIRLPAYMSLMLLVSAVIAVVVVGWTIPVRQAEQPPNAFIDYTAVLPGQPRSAVVGMGFSCNSGNSSGTSDYCTRATADGPFSLVAVTLSDGIVSRTSFSVHKGTLTIGDLALMWGRPHIRLYRQSTVFEWPSLGVSAEGWVEGRRFSYAIPVLRIAFVPPAVADG